MSSSRPSPEPSQLTPSVRSDTALPLSEPRSHDRTGGHKPPRPPSSRGGGGSVRPASQREASGRQPSLGQPSPHAGSCRSYRSEGQRSGSAVRPAPADTASQHSQRPPPPPRSQRGSSGPALPAEPPAKPIPPWRDMKRSDARSSRSAGSVSVTSSEAMRKLGQLEQLLERERGARKAAEDTLRDLLEKRRGTQEASGEGQAQVRLDAVMSTLRTILGDGTTTEQLVRIRREQQRRGRPKELRGKSLIDELGGDGDQSTGSSRHRATAARSGFTVDHRGGLHFKPVPTSSSDSRRTPTQTELPPITAAP
eukprot:TRINITY_DN48134_c0_g1_i1.p1 TRINITY_DN48134_c0_g1~~TRINITY_DN48134_c0_g1_i1.p1  ORF type:complete len:309 (+),score=62.12 TRINITY_DN48134_c0_g1_i1:85-1011(+)